MNSFALNFILLFVGAVFCKANPPIRNLQKLPLRIVNGTDAEEGEFPYMVQLYAGNSYSCCGAIIGERWILTAGHCTESKLDTVIYGTNTLYTSAPTSNKANVKKIYPHPKFFYNSIRGHDLPLYDVAILELENPIPFDDKTQPLKLADSDDVPYHVPGILAGWGLNDTDGYLAKKLQKIQLQLLDSLECAREIANFVGFDAFNSTHDLCSDDHFNGECYGDSGSPFVINGLGYGVVSWSIKPCGSNPGTYSRITNPEYRSFIREITGI